MEICSSQLLTTTYLRSCRMNPTDTNYTFINSGNILVKIYSLTALVLVLSGLIC